jgi:hypothetical protein
MHPPTAIHLWASTTRPTLVRGIVQSGIRMQLRGSVNLILSTCTLALLEIRELILFHVLPLPPANNLHLISSALCCCYRCVHLRVRSWEISLAKCYSRVSQSLWLSHSLGAFVLRHRIPTVRCGAAIRRIPPPMFFSAALNKSGSTAKLSIERDEF